jgi:hypothetical protein
MGEVKKKGRRLRAISPTSRKMREIWGTHWSATRMGYCFSKTTTSVKGFPSLSVPAM